MASGEVITGQFDNLQQDTLSDDQQVIVPSAPRLVNPKALTEDLLNLARKDITVFHFHLLVDVAQGQNIEASERVLEKLEAYIDDNSKVLPEVAAIINELYPGQAELHRDLPHLAVRYATNFNRKAKASDIPTQEQRWAFIRNAQTRLESYQSAEAAVETDQPTVNKAVA